MGKHADFTGNVIIRKETKIEEIWKNHRVSILIGFLCLLIGVAAGFLTMYGMFITGLYAAGQLLAVNAVFLGIGFFGGIGFMVLLWAISVANDGNSVNINIGSRDEELDKKTWWEKLGKKKARKGK